ncbi:MAG: amidohydrolase [Bacillota bacterium]|nr:amidohydrolase [Bacillota bacterium]
MLLIKNCMLIDMNQVYKEKRDILIDGKKIVQIADHIEEKEDYEIVDAQMKLVTPGLIESHCHMGVYDSGVESGIDGNETSDPLLPGLRGLDAINPYDVGFYAARKHGVTTIVTGPGSANIMGGTFVALKTSAEDLDQRIIKEEAALKMALGENPKRVYGSKGKSPTTRMGAAALMREEFFKAKNYYDKVKIYQETGKEEDKPKYDIHLESLARAFDGLRVKIHAHQEEDIMTAVRIGEEFGLNYSIEHTTSGKMILDFLKDHNVDCIVGPSLGFKTKYELKHKGVEVGGLMEKAGIKFAITTDHPVIPIEAMLSQAIIYIKEGASEKCVLEALTINAARITDIEDRVGSLEVGKDADLVIWDVPPFDSLYQPGKVFINGKLAYEYKEDGYDFDYKEC